MNPTQTFDTHMQTNGQRLACLVMPTRGHIFETVNELDYDDTTHFVTFGTTDGDVWPLVTLPGLMNAIGVGRELAFVDFHAREPLPAMFDHDSEYDEWLDTLEMIVAQHDYDTGRV